MCRVVDNLVNAKVKRNASLMEMLESFRSKSESKDGDKAQENAE